MVSVSDWPINGTNIFYDDVGGCAEVFHKSAGRMFSDGPGIDIEVCVLGSPSVQAKAVKDVDDLGEFFKESNRKSVQNAAVTEPSARCFFIPLKHSRSEIRVTKEAMTLILSQIQAFPAFVNIISSIGLLTRETTSTITGFSSFNATISEDNSSFETAYMLKYVEPNNLTYGDPWSIRTMSIYQAFNHITSTSDSILIHLSTQVKKRLSQLNRDGNISKIPNHWTNLHSLLLGTLSHNWSSYISDVETSLSKVDFNYFFTKIDTTQNQTALQFSDLQMLNQGIDKLHRITHALQLNIDVLNQISSPASLRAVVEGPSQEDTYKIFTQNLQNTLTSQKFLHSHVTLLQTFADRRASQLRDAIALQNSNITLSQTQKSIQEAQTMRTLTLVALVYLPATFVASFLSMGFMHVSSLGGVIGVDVSRDMWLYLIFTLPLMVCTFLIWGMWDWRMKRKGEFT